MTTLRLHRPRTLRAPPILHHVRGR